MKISNKKLFTAMWWFAILVSLTFLFDILIGLLPGSLSNLFPRHELAIFSFAILSLLAITRWSFFAYEYEYEIIHIDTKSLIFGPFESRQHKHYEFSKGILKNYHIERSFLKAKLVLTVQSYQGEKKLRHFDLFFLSPAKQEYIENSLKIVLEKNNGKAGK